MIDFKKGDGLVPVIVQDWRDKTVLMLAYANEESWQKTIETKRLCFYSRSRKELWTKGETSGNYLHLKSYSIDCDEDTILCQVEPVGPTCHTGAETCFGERSPQGFAGLLEDIITKRLEEGKEESYTSSLAQRGIAKVAQKVGEEAVELVIEAMRDSEDDFIDEAADLYFHYLLLVRLKGFSFLEIEKRLHARNSNA